MKKLFCKSIIIGLFLSLLVIPLFAKEKLDWYIMDNAITVTSRGEVHEKYYIQLAIGYNISEKKAQAELKSRKIELIDFLRRFFSNCSAEDLKPENDAVLRAKLKDEINQNLLTKPFVEDVKFIQKRKL
ncbi:flagellar basal body-associated FliL family protein [Treponema sp.]|uniref:flagellar basal body-associated FliL family protein n=1 Tax=Treponema sp. TaxID=166 RepID=UPI0025E57057|nr:flagellar basal body-associated FliL family protein [Treponema sp.]MCR5218463.1 flagellar basal body-associated FliL family protein [Treponema sp.]